jgi:hypothetical protein
MATTITLEHLHRQFEQLRLADAGLMRHRDILMPNGKRLVECSDEYLNEVEEAFTRLMEDE